MKPIFQKITVLAAGAVLLAFCAELALRVLGSRYATTVPAIERKAGDAYTILCLGDSFTFGAGAAAESSYPRQLENILKARFPARGFRVVNAGEVAQNTAQVLRDLAGNLAKVRPDCVVLLSGGANFWNYWGYRSGFSPPRESYLERIRLVRLARLFAREISRLAAEADRQKRGEGARTNKYLHNQCLKATPKVTASGAGLKKTLYLCEKAVAFDPRDSDAMACLGMLSIAHSNAEEGVRWLKKAVAISPENQVYYGGLHTGYTRLNDPAEADAAAFAGELDISAWIRQDLNEILDRLAAGGAAVLMQSYPSLGDAPRDPTRRAARIMREVAAARSVPFVDQAAEFERLVAQGRKAEYFAPGNPHCSALGYGLMAARVADEIVKRKLVPGISGETGK